MISNFNHIYHTTFRRLADTLGEAEKYVHVAPIYTAILCRKSLEEWVRWLYANDVDLEQPYDTSLNSLLHHQEFLLSS
jgi:type I restriction enzyme R subunit